MPQSDKRIIPLYVPIARIVVQIRATAAFDGRPALKDVKHLALLRDTVCLRIERKCKYLYCSCISIECSHPQGASGDRAAHRKFGQVILQVIERAKGEETIKENRRSIAVLGSVGDKS